MFYSNEEIKQMAHLSLLENISDVFKFPNKSGPNTKKLRKKNHIWN